ncbi:hypothetical protein Aglo03_24500 [Actinokineospora globicatena]|uniref:Uncharacterized protein n=2 Tax=Actinokineospora globicatena TaxID=103729 RepID=A0A9W6QN74_9PSEU|nr:hypothetical protein Aglo03_24500 [Actinokineospora globicatena]
MVRRHGEFSFPPDACWILPEHDAAVAWAPDQLVRTCIQRFGYENRQAAVAWGANAYQSHHPPVIPGMLSGKRQDRINGVVIREDGCDGGALRTYGREGSMNRAGEEKCVIRFGGETSNPAARPTELATATTVVSCCNKHDASGVRAPLPIGYQNHLIERNAEPLHQDCARIDERLRRASELTR